MKRTPFFLALLFLCQPLWAQWPHTSAQTLLDSVYEHDWSAPLSTWTLSYKEILAYDSITGFQTRNTGYVWSLAANGWEPANMEEYLPDSAGHRGLLYSYYHDAASGSWNASQRNSYTYNAAGLLTSDISAYLDAESKSWVPMVRNAFTFNSSGHKTELLLSTWSLDAWHNHTRQQFTNTPDGQPLLIITSAWDAANSLWTPTWKDSFVYVNGLQTEFYKGYWNTSSQQWRFSSRQLHRYSPAGKRLSILYQNGAMAPVVWDTAELDTFLYHPDGELAEGIRLLWEAPQATWRSHTRKLYTWLAPGRIDQFTAQMWNSSTATWVNSDRETSYYSLHTIGTGIASGEKNRMAGFPNPAHEALILTGIQAPALLVLYDLQGRPVHTHFADGPETRLDLSLLPPGLYLLPVQGQTLRVVKR